MNDLVLENIEQDRVLRLIATFNGLFLKAENTVLELGDDEPLYQPASDEYQNHKIIFAHGFFASALHEISHWLVAGKERRKLEDYGYWYKPDGRSDNEQKEFEKVEVKPQAIEWILSIACGHTFHFSADNLNANSSVSPAFKNRVRLAAVAMIEEKASSRLALLLSALTKEFSQGYPEKTDLYDQE